MKYIDLRSDTVTWPTPKMRKAMAEAAVGDDVYGDDPTVNELEEAAAKKVGKPKALFVPSGTFGNQLALYTWCPRGSEVILGEQCHIVEHEAGAPAVIAGVQLRTIPAPTGNMELAAIEALVRSPSIHHPPTSLICLENAHSSGHVLSLKTMETIYQYATSQRLPVHLDGARLFNAAAALGVDAANITASVDSVMFCLSKGLCAPIGSILAGPSDFIDQARHKRKIMGGGLRQVGILAAAGLIALNEMPQHLGTDHKRARLLAQKLQKIPEITLDLTTIQTNMIFFKLTPQLLTQHAHICTLMKDQGILINPPDKGYFRFVTHYWIDENAIEKAVAAFSHIITTVKRL